MAGLFLLLNPFGFSAIKPLENKIIII